VTRRAAHDTANREVRLHRSLKRLGYDLVEAERSYFHIRRAVSKDHETPHLFGLDLAGVDAWIREQVHSKRSIRRRASLGGNAS
jgi:hypothetical protein